MLHIPEIVDLIVHQEINNLLSVFTDYNEDLIRVFYDGLQSSQGYSFHFKMGKHSYHITQDMWVKVFGISILSLPNTLSDHSYHPYFDLNNYLNLCLKAQRPDDCVDIVSAGSLKRNPRILHCIVTHVLV